MTKAEPIETGVMMSTTEKNTILGFKGFNKEMKCRNFQFEEGKTYKHDGPVKVCASGFHFCENPIDIFNYYSPGDSVFNSVSGSGEISRHGDDSKISCSEITIGASISLHDFITSGIKFLFSRKYEEKSSGHSTGYRSASSATGDSSASSVTGDSSASVCTGLNSKAMAGKYGCIALSWLNDKEKRGEMRCAETGCGDGSDGKLKANTWYHLVDGVFAEV